MTNLSFFDDGRVAVKSARTTALVRTDAIVLARAAGNYTVIVTDVGEMKVRLTLPHVVELLRCAGMAPVRRGLAVNLRRVDRVVRHPSHRLVVVLDDQREIDVGRGHQRLVRAWFEISSAAPSPSQPAHERARA